MRVKCLAQEHNMMTLARAQTRTAQSGVKRTNHEATAPPNLILKVNKNLAGDHQFPFDLTIKEFSKVIE